MRPAALCRKGPGREQRPAWALAAGFAGAAGWLLAIGLAVAVAAPPGEDFPAPRVDDARARQAGIRRIDGRHLMLYTDLSARRAIDEIPRVYDAAVVPWARYLGIDTTRVESWRLTGFLMQRRATFRRLGLLPERLPPFRHGYQLGGALWAYDKPSDYYRRHLVLHEGVHGIMRKFLRGTGRPWFREGMAELLATHRWDGEHLEIDVMPAHRDDVPLLGRIKVIRQAVADRRVLRLPQIFRYADVVETEQYAWCWAACYFLSHHPRYAPRFRRLLKVCHEPVRFSSEVAGLFPADDAILDEDWQLFVHELDYGYDIERAVVEYRPGAPWDGTRRTIRIDVTRTWQSTGLRVETGAAYDLRVEGRYRIAVGKDGRPWESEANGITIHYYGGRPIGMVLAAIRADEATAGARSALLEPLPIGTGTVLRPSRSGTLYVRINESPKTLRDNAGDLQLTVRKRP